MKAKSQPCLGRAAARRWEGWVAWVLTDARQASCMDFHAVSGEAPAKGGFPLHPSRRLCRGTPSQTSQTRLDWDELRRPSGPHPCQIMRKSPAKSQVTLMPKPEKDMTGKPRPRPRMNMKAKNSQPDTRKLNPAVLKRFYTAHLSRIYSRNAKLTQNKKTNQCHTNEGKTHLIIMQKKHLARPNTSS